MVNPKEYYDAYNLCRNLINQEEILPNLDFESFKRYVSRENWMPIPLKYELVEKKQDITNSKRPHICIVLEKNTIAFDIFYNGTQSVKNFMNILEKESLTEKREFINVLKLLDERFSYHLLYCEKFFSAAPEWETEIEGKCENLTDEKIEQLLNKIKEVLQKREFRQSIIPNSHIASLGMAIADVTVNKNDSIAIKDALQNVIDIFKVCTKIKSFSEINKIRKEDEKQIKVRKCPDCSKVFEYNTARTICPKCIVEIEKSTIKKKDYDLLKREDKVLS